MTSAHVLDGTAMSATQSTEPSLSSVGRHWAVANILPQALVAAASWAYLTVSGLSAAELIAPGNFAELPHPAWYAIGTTVIYVAMTGWMRGAVLRPLVPRFSILGWAAAAIWSGVVVLALTASASFVGILTSKGLALSGGHPVPVPTGLALAPFVLGIILAAEIIGLIVGGLPGLGIGAVEALAACRTTGSKCRWILWTAAAWSTIVTIIGLHAFLVVLYPGLSSGVLNAIALAMPLLLGIASALITLPAVAQLVRRKTSVD
jgi:hypothetical protein